MKRAFTDIPEGQMHYRTEGQGEPVLLLHMAVASSDEFTRVMHILSKKMGYGSSKNSFGMIFSAVH